ncbi:MAG: V-type ATPase kDa subunit [Clostridia bacterium]|jgi:V/A-type H+-transporting ATPase subunit I|nr:V-type ATPase kDa subunit [Clostridia bacterium]
MAVEKMKVIGIVGNNSDLDKVARMVVMNGTIHMLNAISELNSNCLELKASEDNINAMQELTDIRPYRSSADFSEDEKIIKAFHDVLNIKPAVIKGHINPSFNYHELMGDLKKSYDDAKNTLDEIEELNSQIATKQNYIQNLRYAKIEDLDVGVLLNLKYFDFNLMSLSREKYKKLKLNYENIPSVVIHLGVFDDSDIVAALTPKELKEDAERIFTSLNIFKLDIPKGYTGSTENIIRTLQQEISTMKREIEELKAAVQLSREKYQTVIVKSYTMLMVEKKIEEIKSEIALGENLFFMFGFVPMGEIDKFQSQVKCVFQDRVILVAADVENRKYGHSPPTKLKNNILFKPFESLVEMYGIPTYNEKDPTPFFALSYMLLFGAMFGDVGQGFVIFALGLILKYIMKNNAFGGILSRLGISSMIFGLLYGSVFGNEEIIEHLLIKPMDNINTMLISAIVLGVVLINIGYIYSLINLYKRKDLEEGVFGREGVVGYLFFWTLILLAIDKVLNILGVPTWGYIVTLAVLLLLMVFKQPLAHMIKGNKELYEDSPADYYIEAGFGVIETILSVLSNIISFIRVGAFALNHVGLYIAFATMAEMMNSHAAGVVVLIVGNIVIIGLEGLIVFIQSLRLEYYELFSKYYSGYGIPYKPVQIYNHEDY